MATVTELVTKFSFVGSESPLTKYNQSLGASIGLMAGMTAATFAASAAVGKWLNGILAAEQPLINLQAETGVAIERIQELGFIASVSNSSFDAMNSTLSSLTQKIGDAAQKGSEDFARLGISVRDANGQVKSADQILDEVGNRFKQLNLSMGEQRSFAAALGIDSSLLTMLNRTDKEMASLTARARELGVLNKEQAQQAQVYNDSITAMRFGLDGLRRLVAVGLAPELKKMADTFTNLLTANMDWIVNGIKFSIGVLFDFTAMLTRLWPILAIGIGIFLALNTATLAWVGTMILAFAPVVLAVGVIAGLAIAIDDLIVGMQGGKSAIFDFFKGFDLVPDWVKTMFSGDVNVSASNRMGNGQMSRQNTNNSNVNQDIKMEINTSDPVKAGEVAADTLQRQMKNAKTQSRRGGR